MIALNEPWPYFVLLGTSPLIEGGNIDTPSPFVARVRENSVDTLDRLVLSRLVSFCPVHWLPRRLGRLRVLRAVALRESGSPRDVHDHIVNTA